MIRTLIRAPLAQFLLIGAGLFLGTRVMEVSRERAAHRIVVDIAQAQRLAQLYQVQTGVAPSRIEVDHLIDNYIREEVLYREALKLGLDRDDEIIRRRLVQKMEFLNSDLAASAAPTGQELRHYYTVHSTEFALPATVTFIHIYFSPDLHSEEGAKRAAEAALKALRSQGDLSRVRQPPGDPFPLQTTYSELTESDVIQVFGHTPIVAALFSASAGRWCGPFHSGYGWHLIFLSERNEQRVPSFESVKGRVQSAYEDEERSLANERWNREMESRYAVERQYSLQARR